jgi:hypothetical protein
MAKATLSITPRSMWGTSYAAPERHLSVLGNEVRAGDDTEFLRAFDTGKAHEILEVILIGATGLWWRAVRKPLDFRRHVSKVEEHAHIERC